jgi:phosphonate ABC transporter permease subunit PhnE
VQRSPTKETRNPFVRFFAVATAVSIIVVAYAFAFDRTKVNLEPIKDEQRKVSLVRIIRGLSRPDILDFEAIETFHIVEVTTPCQPGGFEPAARDTDGPYIEMFPTCALPGSDVTVRGHNFQPNQGGPLSFIPPSAVTLKLAQIRADEDGEWEVAVELPDRPDEVIQHLRFTTKELTGAWTLSDTALNTWDKMVETVALAFVATTLGTIVGIPLSFMSARNLMRSVRTPLVSVALFFIGLPVGILAGRQIGRWVTDVSANVGSNAVAQLGLSLAVAIAGWLALRLTLREDDDEPTTPGEQTLRWLVVSAVVVGALFSIGFFGRFLFEVGSDIREPLGVFGFLGGFIRTIGDLLTTFLTFGAALTTGVAAAVLGTKLGHFVNDRLPAGPAATIRTIASAVAVALLAAGLGGMVQWMYELQLTSNARATTPGGIILALTGGLIAARLGRVWVSDVLGGFATVARFVISVAGIAIGLTVGIFLGVFADAVMGVFGAEGTLWAPAALGAALGIAGAVAARHQDQLPSGMAAYYSARTLFNGVRSIEPLVMAIVFVVWVGIGPFAGALALGLHTIAGLAKLYSEQVESIMEGPVEAVAATGATKLQNIVYAVVPQIVPPYIAFTLYRWDINVRMSTIIGFAGGGGVGFLLQQNINLLQYKAASVQMLAIAVVVATLDFVSANIRSRIV